MLSLSRSYAAHVQMYMFSRSSCDLSKLWTWPYDNGVDILHSSHCCFFVLYRQAPCTCYSYWGPHARLSSPVGASGCYQPLHQVKVAPPPRCVYVCLLHTYIHFCDVCSVWSNNDHLYDDIPKHWSGPPVCLSGMILIDGKPYRWQYCQSLKL